MKDRELAYEQNVVGLEIAWRDRIEARAMAAARKVRSTDSEMAHEEKCEAATDAAERMLLDSEQWQNVTAVDISDIATEAVDRIVASGRLGL